MSSLRRRTGWILVLASLALPLFTVQSGQVRVATLDRALKPQRGQTLVAIVENGSGNASQTEK